ncbi:1-deoxy-D-xylulose 5-phosphate reductoisomerase [Tepidimonas aquatica]|uniref:1-deoxy-D-xylulose 5-phosphate reductoisomerase n=1 Tax=Tepidimonas aquatica TaxID=247482 RepID=A0A554WVF3_9BURK|nr:1-deoxy-D-xylulose 5-phosphate reductoisomerase [Tepidimonas aquatica]
MVQYRDRSVVAQLGTPDMRVPIAYGQRQPDPQPRRCAAMHPT